MTLTLITVFFSIFIYDQVKWCKATLVRWYMLYLPPSCSAALLLRYSLLAFCCMKFNLTTTYSMQLNLLPTLCCFDVVVINCLLLLLYFTTLVINNFILNKMDLRADKLRNKNFNKIKMKPFLTCLRSLMTSYNR